MAELEPAKADVLGDLEALDAHKRRIFDLIEIRQPRGGYVKYTPHEFQAKAHFPGRFLTHQMLACGRRGGKTQFDIAEALAMLAIEGTVTWVGAPTYALTDRIFQPLFRYLAIEQIFGVEPRTVRNSAAHRLIEMPWGATVEGKSAERPASSKGASLDLFIDDECAEHDEEFFTEYVGPGLADRQGKAIFTSTPLGLTWFHEYYKRGNTKKFQKMGWQSHTWRSEDNPYLDKDWLHQQYQVIQPHVKKQEYDAQFLARSGMVWEDFRDTYFDGPERGHLFNSDRHPVDPSWPQYRGIDIGTNHPTGAVILSVDPKGNAWIHTEYCRKSPTHQEHARGVSSMTHGSVCNTMISWEANAGDGKGGETVLQIYRKEGVYANLAPKDRQMRIDAVAAYMHSTLEDAPVHPRLFISDRCRRLIAQIKAYRWKDRKPSQDAGVPKPHRVGIDDDLCDAMGHILVTKPMYTPQWLEEASDNKLTRYGHQNSAFARVTRPQGVIGMPGLATLPEVN